MPAVTAVVVTWNSAPDLVRCLPALPDDVSVIVVDNASLDLSAAVAREHGATVIDLDKNVGFPAAVNRALPSVETSITLLLNPDVLVEPGTIEACADALSLDRQVGVVGADLRTPDGSPEPPAARRDRRTSDVLVETLGLTHVHPRFDRQVVRDRNEARDVDAVNGAFVMIRTDLLRELGGLDETCFLYLEDQDLCRRVRDRGLRVRFVAGARAVHGGGTSTARADDDGRIVAYLHRIDADLEFLRRYRGQGARNVALVLYVVRSLLGILVSLARPALRPKYRRSLAWLLQQRSGRLPPPPVA